MEWELRPGRDERLAGNLDTSLLKTLALCFMLIDHLGVALFGNLLEMRVLGRIALPLYAWCLIVGNVKTRHPLRYFGRLLLLAVLSQPLYMMALSHSWRHLNILFLLALATAAIQSIRLRRFGSQFWGPALCYLLLGFCEIDYGWRGLTFILLLYLARESRGGLAAAFLGYALFWGSGSQTVTTFFGYELGFLRWPGLGDLFSAFFHLQTLAWLALPLILTRTSSGLKMPKWLGYGLYPLHLVLLIVLRLMFGGATWAGIVSCFH